MIQRPWIRRGRAVRALSAFVLAVAALATLPASAGAADAKDTTARRAKALFEEGLALSDEGKWSDALSAFQRSDALVSSASARYNVAASLRALGRYVEAEHVLQGILEEAGRSAPGKPPSAGLKSSLRTEVPALLAEVKKKVVVVTLRVDPPDAVVEADGAPLARIAEVDGAELDPGRHVFVVRAPGYDTTTVTKAISASDATLVLTAPRSSVRTSEAADPVYKRWWPWTIAGVVLAGAGAAIVVVETRPRTAASPPPNTANLVVPASFRF
jgi:hypothetical protein